MAVKIENEKLFVTINEHGAELASLIDKKAKIQVNVIPHCEVKNYYHVSSAQKRIYYTDSMMDYKKIVYNVSGSILVDCI